MTVQVTLSTAVTPVLRSTPGPKRWKLWSFVLSVTATVYVPSASVVTGVPSEFFSEMFQLSSTVPVSVPVAVAAGRATVVAAPNPTSASRTLAPATPADRVRASPLTPQQYDGRGKRIASRLLEARNLSADGGVFLT